MGCSPGLIAVTCFLLAGIVVGTASGLGSDFRFLAGASAGVAGAGDRLVLVAGLLVWPALMLLVMVSAVALARLMTAAFDPLKDQESSFQLRAQRALTNSVEQTAIFAPALLAAAVLADPGDIRFAGVMTALFCAARGLFWVGYVINSLLQGAGHDHDAEYQCRGRCLCRVPCYAVSITITITMGWGKCRWMRRR